MKAVILAGGLGTRFAEETEARPKPMIEIGGRPIIWHIMKGFASHGVSDFIICLGYKGYVVKEFFVNYYLHQTDVVVDIEQNTLQFLNSQAENWKVTLVDTGVDSMTGGRLRRVKSYLGNETFCLTYGDGVSDVNIEALVAFHKEHGRNASVTAVSPPGRFGALDIADTAVRGFREKPMGDGGLINGGFFVLEPSVIDLIDGDATVWEQEPLETLARTDQLRAYHHRGFWHAMDTLRDKRTLEQLWAANKAPWKTW